MKLRPLAIGRTAAVDKHRYITLPIVRGLSIIMKNNILLTSNSSRSYVSAVLLSSVKAEICSGLIIF